MSKVSIAKCDRYDLDKVHNAVKQALKDIGFEMPKGKKVLVKPNILGAYKPEEAVTTHPALVEAICKLLKENDCKTIVGESSGFTGSTKNCLLASGIQKAAEKYGAEALSFESTTIIQKKINGKVLDKIALPSILDEVDMIISLPKLKTHTLMTYTAGVKNLFGLVPGGRKSDYHNMARDPKKFAELLCDIYETVKPKLKLTIADAIVGMEGNGPAAGKAKQTGLVIASDDAGALDYAVQKITGLESPTMKCLAERKLLDTRKIEIASELPRIPYKPPSSFMSISSFPPWLQNSLESQMTAHPHVKKKKCIKCGACAKSCPAKAITLAPYPDFNRKKCIDCYCCHELCPKHAIYLKGPPGHRLIKLLLHLKSAVQKPGNPRIRRTRKPSEKTPAPLILFLSER